MYIPSLLLDAFAHALDATFSVTDIVFREGMPCVLKGAGNMESPTPSRVIDRAEINEMLTDMTPHYNEIIQRHGQLEMSYSVSLQGLDELAEPDLKTVRVTGLTYAGGTRVCVIIRINSDTAWPIKQLLLPEIAENAIRDLKPGGLLLVAGPMASGKSTTMYSAVHLLNSLTPQTIVTIEDPIETRLDSGLGLIIQREVCPYGRDADQPRSKLTDDGDEAPRRLAMGDVPDFITGVRGAMRQSLKGMLIMEIRDSETAEAALRAAEAGLWVVAGIHASESVGALDRLVNFAPADQRPDRARLLHRRLHAVLFQKLVPNKEKTASVLATEVLYPKGSTELKEMKAFKDAFYANDIGSLQNVINDNAKSATQLPDVLSLNRSLFTLTLTEKISKDAAFAASYDLHGLKELFKQANQ